jgi:HEAT repeat protein
MKRVLGLVLAVALAGCGQEPPPPSAHGKSVDEWVRALQGPDARLRQRAARTLGNAGAADPAVVPALAGALRDRDAGVRGEAALALMKIGPDAREAVPALTEARKDRDARVRTYAARALEKVQDGP